MRQVWCLFDQNFFSSRFPRTKIFFGATFFLDKKIFWMINFFRTKSFLEQNFFRLNIWDKKNHGQKIYFFWTKYLFFGPKFLDKKSFLDRKLFWATLYFGYRFLWPKIVLTQFFYEPKFSGGDRKFSPDLSFVIQTYWPNFRPAVNILLVDFGRGFFLLFFLWQG